jgi:hypothetical protein
MKNKMKKEWIAALRSGSYNQAKQLLHVPSMNRKDKKPGYCCLGVLFDSCLEDEWEWTESDDTNNSCGWGIAIPGETFNIVIDSIQKDEYGLPCAAHALQPIQSVSTISLPSHILAKVGLTGLEQTQLMELNDEKNWNFQGIAQWIEENIEAEPSV